MSACLRRLLVGSLGWLAEAHARVRVCVPHLVEVRIDFRAGGVDGLHWRAAQLKLAACMPSHSRASRSGQEGVLHCPWMEGMM